MEFTVRETTADDSKALELLYADMFPDQDLWPLVSDLLAAGRSTMSLVASDASDLHGHIGFSRCSVGSYSKEVALLAPLGVRTAMQGRGIGGTLVGAGFERLKAQGIGIVLVLGDPGYYSRFGFAQEDRINPPYPLPEQWKAAWQSLVLGDNGDTIQGTLRPPEFWLKQALWSPPEE